MNNVEPQPPRTDTSSPPTDDELAELMDPESWDWDNALIGVPAPDPTLTIGVRLNAEEARILGDAARAAKMPLSRYIKYVSLEAAGGARNVVSSHDETRGAA